MLVFITRFWRRMFRTNAVDRFLVNEHIHFQFLYLPEYKSLGMQCGVHIRKKCKETNLVCESIDGPWTILNLRLG